MRIDQMDEQQRAKAQGAMPETFEPGSSTTLEIVSQSLKQAASKFLTRVGIITLSTSTKCWLSTSG
jgi:hypothetical protein